MALNHEFNDEDDFDMKRELEDIRDFEECESHIARIDQFYMDHPMGDRYAGCEYQ